jgi:hypothetical protein
MRKLTTTFAVAAVLAASTPAMAYSYADSLHDKLALCISMGGTPEDYGSRRVGASRYVPYVDCRMADGTLRRI